MVTYLAFVEEIVQGTFKAKPVYQLKIIMLASALLYARFNVIGILNIPAIRKYIDNKYNIHKKI